MGEGNLPHADLLPENFLRGPFLWSSHPLSSSFVLFCFPSNRVSKLEMGPHTFNSSAQESEAGGSL